MFRTSKLVVKKMADVKPGELLRISFGAGAGVAMFLRKDENGTGIFGVLRVPGFERPMLWYRGALDETCLTYGLDWVVEEIHGDETGCGLQYRGEGARLFIGDSGLVMTFSPAERGVSGFGRLQFSLALADLGDHLGHSPAPIERWRVWESQEHLERGGEPLFEMLPKED